MSLIEPAVAEELDALAALHHASFERGWNTGELAAFLADPGVIALALKDDDAVPAGFVLARLAADEADLLTIAVSPLARRRGYGRALLDALAAELAGRGICQLYLEVCDQNVAALALYNSFGFRRVGVRRNYYSRGGGNAFTMAYTVSMIDGLGNRRHKQAQVE